MDSLTMIGVAALAAMVHATFSLGLVGLAIRFFRISPVARSWMLAVAMSLPALMAGRSFAMVVSSEARIRAAFNELTISDADLSRVASDLAVGDERADYRAAHMVIHIDDVSETEGGVLPPGFNVFGPQPDLSGGSSESRNVIRTIENETGEFLSSELGAVLPPLEPGVGQWVSREREVSLLPGRAEWLEWALPMAGLVWIGGALFQIGRAVRNGFAVSRMVAGSVPAHPELAAQASAIARSSGLQRLHVRTVEGLGSPFAASGNRLVLPAWISDLTRSRRQAILAHEIAHLRARDPQLQLALVPFTALLWPHPLLGWAAGAMRQAVEHRCDDVAIESTDRVTLAHALAEVAERLNRNRPSHAGGHLAVSGAPISDRVARALGDDRGGRAWVAMAGVALLCAFTLILPPADPGPAYQLQVVQTQEVIRDVLVNAEVSGEGLHRNSPASGLPLSDS